MKLIQKFISKLFELPLPFIDKMAYLRYFNQPHVNYPMKELQSYHDLAKFAHQNTYSIEDVDQLENESGYSVDEDWLYSLALHTQVVIKKSKLNYAHGRILYSILRKYLQTHNDDFKKINIFETGTARGFSSICMAKALYDSNFEGTIFTFDVLPHFKKMYWNCIQDHINGEQTRQGLLENWENLVERYIVFIQGYTKHILPKIALPRINFAFLDGAHTYDDVMFEFNMIKKLQKKGDMIVFDDYNKKNFSGVVRAIKFIESEQKYDISFVHNKDTYRDYVIAKKN